MDCYKEDMLEFLENFDPIKQKYHVFKDLRIFSPEVSAAGALFDSAYQYGPLTKQEFSGILQNLHLVYGNEETVCKDIKTYYAVERGIIHRFLGLPLLDQMFDEDYFNFEWDMHVGQNFQEHRSEFYRDHFVHQVRNMYMMHCLLNEWFYLPSMDALVKPSNSKIAEYTCLKLAQFMLDKQSKEYQLFGSFIDDIKSTALLENKADQLLETVNVYRKYYPVSNNPKGLKLGKLDDLSVDDYAYHYFYNYVIYASAYMSALFHDMGYPICHFLEIRSRLSVYNPTMYMITQNITGSFDNISSKLSDSLLFTIVSHREIQSRLELSGNGKYDHGAYSAITFLLQYYETGAIQKLSPEKQCAIELAAIAIYNHTQAYACVEKDACLEYNYYQPVFRQNPVSFLLHFCDDLQEWDRRYFEISDASAVSICSDCYGVLMPHKPLDLDDLPIFNRTDEYKKRWGAKNIPIDRFDCFCTPNQKPKCFRRQVFSKRQIYLVTTSPEVRFVLASKNHHSVLRANIVYDYYRLLKMSHINNTYAKFRLKDIRELKCRLDGQRFQSQCEGFPFNDIYVSGFMTSNPILIKVKILEDFLRVDFLAPFAKKFRKLSSVDAIHRLVQRCGNEEKFRIQCAYLQHTICGQLKFESCWDKVLKGIEKADGENWKSIQKELAEKVEQKATSIEKCIEGAIEAFGGEVHGNSNLIKYLTDGVDKKRIDFYVNLLKDSLQLMGANKDWTEKYEEFMKAWSVSDDKFYNSVLGDLVYDCLYQYSKESQNKEPDTLISYMETENYKNIYIPQKGREDSLYDAVLKYCCDDNRFNRYYEPMEDKKDKYVGYFGDLFFFEMLNEALYFEKQNQC